MGAQLDPGSFRDPSSAVFLTGDRVLRGIGPAALDDWQALTRAPFFSPAVARGDIVATEQLPDAPPELAGPWAGVLEHERVPFLSYPYEWTFSMLRDAALLHLDLLIASLDAGMTMKDGYAYNLQFRGSRPVFIDIPSFARGSAGPWPGYRQFCETMLFPLLLVAHRGASFQGLLRGRLDGISPTEMRALLGPGGIVKKGALKHVFLHAAAEGRFNRDGARSLTKDLQGAGFTAELTKATARSLRKLVDQLRWKQSDSAWSAYRQTCSYSDADREAKDRFVAEAVDFAPARLVWDLGCNDGAYAEMAARSADTVVAVDFDPVVVDLFYRRLRAADNRKILPLVMNFADPSPGLGWQNRERPAFTDRGKPDLMLALALIHHLVITAHLPMAGVLDWFAARGGRLVIEFVEPDDPMARQMLASKPADRHEDYRRDVFEKLVGERFEVINQVALPSGHRTLYHLQPRAAGG